MVDKFIINAAKITKNTLFIIEAVEQLFEHHDSRLLNWLPFALSPTARLIVTISSEKYSQTCLENTISKIKD